MERVREFYDHYSRQLTLNTAIACILFFEFLTFLAFLVIRAGSRQNDRFYQ